MYRDVNTPGARSSKSPATNGSCRRIRHSAGARDHHSHTVTTATVSVREEHWASAALTMAMATQVKPSLHVEVRLKNVAGTFVRTDLVRLLVQDLTAMSD